MSQFKVDRVVPVSRRMKNTIERSEGGSFISGMILDYRQIDKYLATNMITNINKDTTFPNTPKEVGSNRPFVTLNQVIEPPARNHMNQVMGSVFPGQLLPYLERSVSRSKTKTKFKLSRQVLLRKLRYVGRVEESSAASNPTPVIPIRVGGMCNFHIPLVNENLEIVNAATLGLTVGDPLYLTLPSVKENTGPILSFNGNEYMLTNKNPLTLYSTWNTAELSPISRFVLSFANGLIATVGNKNGNITALPSFHDTDEPFNALFPPPSTVTPVKFNATHAVTLSDLFSDLIDYVCDRIELCNRGPAGRFVPTTFTPAVGPAAVLGKNPITALEAVLKLQAFYNQDPSKIDELVTRIYEISEVPAFDDLFNIPAYVSADARPVLRIANLVSVVTCKADLAPYAASMYPLNSNTADLVRRELRHKMPNHVRSDLYVGRFLYEEMDGSITVLQTS